MELEILATITQILKNLITQELRDRNYTNISYHYPKKHRNESTILLTITAAKEHTVIIDIEECIVIRRYDKTLRCLSKDEISWDNPYLIKSILTTIP